MAGTRCITFCSVNVAHWYIDVWNTLMTVFGALCQASGDQCCIACGRLGGRFVACEFCSRRVHLDCLEPPIARSVHSYSMLLMFFTVSMFVFYICLFTLLCHILLLSFCQTSAHGWHTSLQHLHWALTSALITPCRYYTHSDRPFPVAVSGMLYQTMSCSNLHCRLLGHSSKSHQSF